MGIKGYMGLFALLFSTSLLTACGGGSPTEPAWLVEDASSTSALDVLDDGTQLVRGASPYLRNSGGEITQTLSLPRGTYQFALSAHDHFVLYGRSGQDVWRISLAANGSITSDSVIYSGTDVTGSLAHRQFGDTHIIHWRDGDFFNWYSENDLAGGQLPLDLSETIFTVTPNQHLWYLDQAAAELVEIDLGTGSELSRSSLNAELLNSYALFVNDGFIVGAVSTSLHTGPDLIAQDRTTQAINYIRSFGGYGTFKLSTLSQDAAGNIYYTYFASVAHSGFSTGMHLRAISNTSLEAWDHKIASGDPVRYRTRFRTLNSGIQMTYIGETASFLEAYLRQTQTSHYLHINADKTVVASLRLQPHTVELSPLTFGSPKLITLGYLADEFAATPQGDIYIYSHSGTAVSVSSRYFAGRY